MIYLTRLNGSEVVVNADLIMLIERIPDTVLTLTTGARILVKEKVEEVVERTIGYRHRIGQGPGFRRELDPPSQGASPGEPPGGEGKTE